MSGRARGAANRQAWRSRACRLALAAALALGFTCGASRTEALVLDEMGLTYGFGQSDRENVQIIPAYLHAGVRLPEFIRGPLGEHDLELLWLAEAWVAGITGRSNGSDAVEAGVNPIGFKLSYDRWPALVPFFAGGVGVLYTGLTGIETGGAFQFDELFRIGFEIPFVDGLKLSLAYQFRHMSNASIYRDNAGLNTHYGLLGLVWHPGAAE